MPPDPATGALNLEAADFLYEEALLLDRRQWRDWLDLYDDDAVFWVPAYTMTGEPVADPELSVNLMYLASRSAMEDRIFRLETEESLASTPLPHTCHLVTNVRAHADGEGSIDVTAAFQVSTWNLKRGSEARAGRYEYRLRRAGDGFRIARKKVILVDEVIDGWFDFYSI